MSFQIFNTLTKRKEVFEPENAPFVGLYVCGPTVYGDAHLGHARPAISFDLVFRYLKYLGYKVRYVRNITDVGHLENDADEGEDKIGKKARLEKLEPMEVVQYFSNRYHWHMDRLNVLRPSIEPYASGHIIEQISMVEKILKNGYAYEVNGSVYFDVEAYSKKHDYGTLSGRKLEDLRSNTRELEGQSEKRSPVDFALWKKASPAHIMRWPSPWSEGFPGWHLECSVMSTKYLGESFDIHGGGMDLLFPHHECEIAQSTASLGHESVKYWMHNNLITINGQKMGKSLGNFITLEELFEGRHKSLVRAYHPMTIRFFILQAHYRGTLDFSNEALQAAEKGLKRLEKGMQLISKLPESTTSDIQPEKLKNKCEAALNDDFNSPILISHLFETIRDIQLINRGDKKITKTDKEALLNIFNSFVFDILGLSFEEASADSSELLNKTIDTLLEIRLNAKKNKDFELADDIRDTLYDAGVIVRDKPGGFEWEIEE